MSSSSLLFVFTGGQAAASDATDTTNAPDAGRDTYLVANETLEAAEWVRRSLHALSGAQAHVCIEPGFNPHYRPLADVTANVSARSDTLPVAQRTRSRHTPALAPAADSTPLPLPTWPEYTAVYSPRATWSEETPFSCATRLEATWRELAQRWSQQRATVWVYARQSEVLQTLAALWEGDHEELFPATCHMTASFI
jgi:hypothetical protein